MKNLLNININDLVPYSKHPFKVYQGRRFEDMVDSIKANGIINPPVVRPLADTGQFEILSGHNRINAAKIVGFTEVQCMVASKLTEDEAYLWVTQSNLMQRSFADLSHSERALVLATDYEATKSQGKRNDLVKEIENLLLNGDKSHEIGRNATSSAMRTKFEVGEKYGLGKTTIAQYIRLNDLLDEFKVMLDADKLSVRAGYDLSFLSKAQQTQLHTYLTDILGVEIKITMKHAEILKRYALEGKFDATTIESVFSGKNNKPKKPKSNINLSFKRKKLVERGYFKEDASENEISQTIMEALEFYKMYNGKIHITVEGDGDKFQNLEPNEQTQRNNQQNDTINNALSAFGI